MDSRLGLPPGTVLDGSYRIARVVGSGGFGITYEAEDTNLATKVAIKEYYPFEFGDRDTTMEVRPRSDRHRHTFDWGRINFLQEARTLARFEHPSIVRITRVFEANATAYMVMRFEQGQSLEAWLSGLGRLPSQAELDAIVEPLLDALELMHTSDFLHRDIAPDNIIVRADGSPVLLDFGSARRAVAQMSRKLTGIVKAGYSPLEQYSSDNRRQGPWSDLYALGGTLYRAVTGRPPDESTLRVSDDHLQPATTAARNAGYRPGFLAGIDACLSIRHSTRPRSVAQVRPILLSKGIVTALIRAETTKSENRPARIERPLQVLKEVTRSLRLEQFSSTLEQAGRSLQLRSRAVALGQAARSLQLKAGQALQPEHLTTTLRQARESLRLERGAFILERASRALNSRRVVFGEARRRLERRAAILRLAGRSLRRDRIKRMLAPSLWILTGRRGVAIAAALAAVLGGGIVGYNFMSRQPDEIKSKDGVSVERGTLGDGASKSRANADARQQAEGEAKVQKEAQASEERASREPEAKRQAEEAARRKTDPTIEESLVVTASLSAEDRAALVKRVQQVLKLNHCYEGAMNGSSNDTQAGLDRFVESARKNGLETPTRIELAKAAASDFDAWLREAGNVKVGLCAATAHPRPAERPRRTTNYPSSRGGGGGGSGMVQGVR